MVDIPLTPEEIEAGRRRAQEKVTAKFRLKKVTGAPAPTIQADSSAPDSDAGVAAFLSGLSAPEPDKSNATPPPDAGEPNAATSPDTTPDPLAPFQVRIEEVRNWAAGAVKSGDATNPERLKEFLDKSSDLLLDFDSINYPDPADSFKFVMHPVTREIIKYKNDISEALTKLADAEAARTRVDAAATPPPPAPAPATPQPGWVARAKEGFGKLAGLVSSLGLPQKILEGAAVAKEYAVAGTARAIRALTPEQAEARAVTVQELLVKRTLEVNKQLAERGGVLKRVCRGLAWLSEQNLEKLGNYMDWNLLKISSDNTTKPKLVWNTVKRFGLRSANLRVALSFGLAGAGILSESGLALAASYATRKGMSFMGAYGMSSKIVESPAQLEKLLNLDDTVIAGMDKPGLLDRLGIIEMCSLQGKEVPGGVELHNKLIEALAIRIRSEFTGTDETTVARALDKNLKDVRAQYEDLLARQTLSLGLAGVYSGYIAPEIAQALKGWWAGSPAEHHDVPATAAGVAPQAPTSPQPSPLASLRPSASSSSLRPSAGPTTPPVRGNLYREPTVVATTLDRASASPHASPPSAGRINVAPSPAPSGHEVVAPHPTASPTHPAPRVESSPRPAVAAPTTSVTETHVRPAAAAPATEHAAPGAATTAETARPSVTEAAAHAPETPAATPDDILKAAGAHQDSAGKFLVEFGKGKIAADSGSALRYIALAEMKLDDPKMLDAMEVAKLLNIRDNLNELLAGHNVAGMSAAELQSVLAKTPHGFRILNEAKLGEAVHKLLIHANAIDDRLRDGGALAWADRLPPGEMAKMRAMVEHPAMPPTTAELHQPAFSGPEVKEILHAKEQVLTHQLHEDGFDTHEIQNVHVDTNGAATVTVLDDAGHPQTIQMDHWGTGDMSPGHLDKALEDHHLWSPDDDVDTSAGGLEHAGTPSAAGAASTEASTGAAAPTISVENLPRPPVGPSINAERFFTPIKDLDSTRQLDYFKRLLKPIADNTPRTIKMPGARTAFLYQSAGKLWISSPNLGVARQALDAGNVNRWVKRILEGK